MASVEMKVHRRPWVPAILAVLAGAAGVVLGGTVGILAWQNVGGGCVGMVGGFPLDPFYPVGCNTASAVGVVFGALIGVGAVLWATRLHRRGRSSTFALLAGSAMAVVGTAGLYGGVHLGTSFLQSNGMDGDPDVLWLFAIAGVGLAAGLVAAVTSILGRRGGQAGGAAS